MTNKNDSTTLLVNEEKSTDVHTVSIATQCGPAVSKEDSNIVTLKSWSDEEDDNEPNDQKNEKKTLDKSENCKLECSEVTNHEENNGQANKGKRKAEGTRGPGVKKLKGGEKQGAVRDYAANKKELPVGKVKKSAKYESTEERFFETSYYFQNGLRKVYPYEYTFKSFAKGRWVGQKILEVFSKEFRAQTSEEYERCLKAGTITVNDEKVNCDYVLKHNDLIANTVHRHEVPVTADPIEIVHIDKDIVVINKPASIPVHPCGRYRHNTIVFILAKEYNLKNLRTVHRLDRLTSGILIFCRTTNRARELEYHIRSRHVKKEYVCRVEGDFPSGVIECNEPIEVVSYKIGVCRVSPNGKECSTTFRKVGYNSKTNSSVVTCQPHTGRMHQIRVHLQYLGYPIIRDPLYNHPVFGPAKGKNGDIGKTNEELIKELIHLHNAENWLGDGEIGVDLEIENSPGSEEKAPELLRTCSSIDSHTVEPQRKQVSCQTNHDEPDAYCKLDKMAKSPYCAECKLRYRDPKPSDMRMYLHAFSYEGPDWAFKTNPPVWAKPDWEESF